MDIKHPSQPDAYQALLPRGVAALAKTNWDRLSRATRKLGVVAMAVGFNLAGWATISAARGGGPSATELVLIALGLAVGGLGVWGSLWARGVDPALEALAAPGVRVVWVLLRELSGAEGLPLISLRLGLSSGQRVSFIVDATLAGGTAEAMRQAGEASFQEAVAQFRPPLVGDSPANERAFAQNPQAPGVEAPPTPRRTPAPGP